MKDAIYVGPRDQNGEPIEPRPAPGFHGPKTLAQLLVWMYNRMRKRDGHFVVILVGLPNMGKTTLAIQMARAVRNGEFDLKRQMCLGMVDGLKLAANLPEYGVIVYDEALSGGGNKRRAMSGNNVAVQEEFNRMRKDHQGHILCNPFFEDFDDAVVKHTQWVGMVNTQGSVDFYEVQLVGLQKKAIWLEHRFTDDFPDLKERDPAFWRKYLEHVAWLRSDQGSDHADAALEEAGMLAVLDRRGVVPGLPPSVRS